MSSSTGTQGYLSRLREYGNEQPTRSFSDALDALGQPYPSWVLAGDATVRAANQLAAWTWGAYVPDPRWPVGAAGLLGRNAFTVVYENLDRIVLAENTDFALAQLALIERISAEYKGARPPAFDLAQALYEGHTPLIRCYEDDPPDPEKVFGYTFSMRPSHGSALNGSLEARLALQTTMSWVRDRAGDGRAVLVQYRPAPDSPETAALLARARDEIADVAPAEPYIWPDELAAGGGPIFTLTEATGLSPLTQAVLSESPVRLHLDRSPASREAVALFADAAEQFQPVAATESGAPWVEFGGRRYAGIEQIRQVVQALRQLDADYRDAVARHVPERLRRSDPAALRWLEEQRQRSLATARTLVGADES